MFLFVRRMLDKAYNKNKKLTVTILLVVILVLIELTGAAFYKYTNIFDYTQDEVIKNTSRLDSMEKRIVTQDTLTRDVVKRENFNSYIKRKDEEYHQQIGFNNNLNRRLGVLEGETSILYKMFHRDVDNE